MTKISKKVELSCKALGAGMFMGIVCLYMALGALSAFVRSEDFYFHVSFAFLIQGMVVSMAASVIWALCFSLNKSWGFFTRYLLVLIALAILFLLSVLFPAIRMTEGYYIWIISGIISTFAFGSAVAVSSSRLFAKTGTRTTLIWEVS